MKTSPPQIITYACYRNFLGDLFSHKQHLNPSFSKRRFAQIAGFKSPNYLQLILDGKRNLSEDSGTSLAKAFKFSSYEKEILLALIKKSGAKNEKEIQEAERSRLLSIKRFVTKQMPSDQAQILSEWYHMVVRELVMLKDFKPEGAWISEKLFNLISAKTAQASFELLLRNGFITEKNGVFELADPVLAADTIHFKETYIRKYHAETLKTWSENLSEMSEASQEAIVLNIPIDSKNIPELKKRINGFVDELIGWLQDEKNADQVVQLGTYLVPFK